MSNCSPFVDRFFQNLTLQENAVRSQYCKGYIHQAIRSFLENENPDTAFSVYRAFFDCYRLTLPGRDDPFMDLVDMLRSYEETAASLIEKQRDHFIHSVNVFICGLSIWAENDRFRQAFSGAVPENGYTQSFPTKEEEFFFRWGIAALFHDMGYPVEIIGSQINRFIRMISDADGDEVRVRAQIRYENFNELNHIQEILPADEYSRDFRAAYGDSEKTNLFAPLDLLAHRIHLAFDTGYDRTKAALDGFVDNMAASGFIDHGYYSALIVLKWYGCALQRAGITPQRFFWPVLDSAAAILLHNYFRTNLQKPPFALGPMPVESNPLAYLLILCDELQEWNREGRGIISRRAAKADTVHLSIHDDYMSAVYVTHHGRLADDFCSKKETMLHQVLSLEDLFPAGFNVDATALDDIAFLKPRLEAISPRPLLKHIELLAIAIHARYNEKRLEEHPELPLAYPDFSALPDDLKYSNLRQAQSIVERLEAAGYALGPKGQAGAVTEFPIRTLEQMAELEHEAWVQERIASGWTLGEKDTARKTTPYLVPYANLSEEIKDYDRDAIRHIPALAETVGMAVYEG